MILDLISALFCQKSSMHESLVQVLSMERVQGIVIFLIGLALFSWIQHILR